MPIAFSCSGCGHQMNAPSQLAGKRVRCRQCNEVSLIPARPTAKEAVIDRFGFDEENAAPRSPRHSSGDGLLGESPPALEAFHPFPAVNREADDSLSGDRQRRGRKSGDDEEPVLGLSMKLAPWVFIGILSLLDLCTIGFMSGSGGVNWRAAAAIMVVVHLLFVGVDGLMILLTSRFCDIEISSLRRVMSVALAIAATTSAASLLIQVAKVGNPFAQMIATLIITAAILSTSLKLGCLGVVGFLFVRMLLYVGLILVGVGLVRSMMP